MPIIECPCGYGYVYDNNKNQWEIRGSYYRQKPIEISKDLKLYACPECGTVFYGRWD